MKLLFAAGVSLAAFIEVLLLSKKKKSIPDRILTIWMMIVAFQLVLFYLYYSGDLYSFPFLLGIDRPIPLLHGVMLYLYVRYLTDQAPKKAQTVALHFLPATLMYLYLVTFFVLPSEQKIEVYRHHGAGYEVFNIIAKFAVLISGVCYVIWSALFLRKHRLAIEDRFSNLDRVRLRWLQWLTYGMGCIWLLAIVFQNDQIVFTGIVVFVFGIAFFGVRQAQIFSHPTVEEKAVDPKEKYQKSGLTEEASAKLHSALIRLMTEEQLYKNSELSIDYLASRLNVHPNYLSQVINQREGKNFYDFVNGYRLDEFKRLIAERKNEQFTLLALAYDSGFSSKTSFNRCFKKAMGATPSEYIAALAPST